jgi:hypothetical protein
MAFKKTTERTSKTGRRWVVHDNFKNQRSTFDKPFFVLPKYMNKDYQKTEKQITPEEFLQDFKTYLSGYFPKGFLEKPASDYNLFDTLTFGKYKNKKIKSITDQQYLSWLLYEASKGSINNFVLVRSLYYYNDFIQFLVSEIEEYKRFGDQWVYHAHP